MDGLVGYYKKSTELNEFFILFLFFFFDNWMLDEYYSDYGLRGIKYKLEQQKNV